MELTIVTEDKTFLKIERETPNEVEIIPTEDEEFLKIEHQEIPKPRGRLALFGEFKRDRVFRLKVCHTALISWAGAAAGWRLAMIGPTFQDLMQIIGVDVSLGSWLLTAFYIGNMTGSLIGGFLYDRFSKTAVIIGWMVLLACSTAVVPWCTSFVTMVIAHVIGGASYGAVDVLTITDVLHVWRSQSVYVLQFVQFCYSIGAIISPLVAGPFLSVKIIQGAQASLSSISNVSIDHDHDNSTVLNEFINASFSGNDSGTDVSVFGESNVHVPYLISAALALLNVCIFMLFYVINGNVHDLFSQTIIQSSSKSRKHNSRELSKRTKLYFVCSLACLLMFHMLAERNFTSYLLSYVATKKSWAKTVGSAATSVYWIAAAISRLIATPVLVCIELTKAMFMYLCISMTGVFVFLVTIYVDLDFLVWIVVALLGFGLAPLFSGWFTWLSVNVVPASGRVTSAMYITGVGGCSLFPPLLGYLMKNFTFDWLIYILLILMTIVSVLFTCVVVLHRKLIKNS